MYIYMYTHGVPKVQNSKFLQSKKTKQETINETDLNNPVQLIMLP